MPTLHDVLEEAAGGVHAAHPTAAPTPRVVQHIRRVPARAGSVAAVAAGVAVVMLGRARR